MRYTRPPDPRVQPPPAAGMASAALTPEVLVGRTHCKRINETTQILF